MRHPVIWSSVIRTCTRRHVAADVFGLRPQTCLSLHRHVHVFSLFTYSFVRRLEACSKKPQENCKVIQQVKKSGGDVDPVLVGVLVCVCKLWAGVSGFGLGCAVLGLVGFELF